ncbi:MAG: four helix bundle protein [Bacteroidales bacterium]|nr:four helix bundle protein [Bacteroidales bacterium]
MEQELDRSVTFFRFEDLRIYHKSIDYADWINTIIEKFPKNERNGLAERFSTVARDISINVAEGSARNKSQFIYYLKMAKSAIRECVVLTYLAAKRDYINEEDEEISRNQLMEMTKMIGALIGSLQRSHQNHQNMDAD